MRERQCVWNPKFTEYKEKSKRDKALEDIVQELNHNNITVEGLKLKIKSIQTRYSTELVKIRKSEWSGGGTDDIYIPKLFWFAEANSFLRTNEWCSVTQFFTHQCLFLLIFFFNNSCKFFNNTSEIITIRTRITSVCAILKWTDSFNIVDTCKQKLNSTTQSIWLIQLSWSLKLNHVNAALLHKSIFNMSFNVYTKLIKIFLNILETALHQSFLYFFFAMCWQKQLLLPCCTPYGISSVYVRLNKTVTIFCARHWQ